MNKKIEPLTFDDSDIEKVKDLKTKFVRAQDYETASYLRDVERSIMNKIERQKEKIKNHEIDNHITNNTFTKEQVVGILDRAIQVHVEAIDMLKSKVEEQEKTIRKLYHAKGGEAFHNENFWVKNDLTSKTD